MKNIDLGDVFAPTYTLVSGTGATDNASFNIVAIFSSGSI
jgi:hypothetical protein